MAATAASDVVGQEVTAALSGNKVDINAENVLIDSVTSGITLGAEHWISRFAGSSSVGRPATVPQTLVNGLLHPGESPRAAWQVYSGISSVVVGGIETLARSYLTRQ